MEKKSPENPLFNIAFNILIPVFVLEQLTKRISGEHGPILALVLALAFPLGYGLFDYVRNKHKNYVSLLGLINILMTGGLAVLKLDGIWFAVKEAAFPAILGAGVFASTFTQRPAMRLLMYNPQILNLETIENRLRESNAQPLMFHHLKKSTLLLTLSFILSSVLNFVLARSIFIPLDPALTELERSGLLNEQISRMTWLSFVVIVLPLMVFTGFLMWYLLRGIQKLTGLQLDEILKK